MSTLSIKLTTEVDSFVVTVQLKPHMVHAVRMGRPFIRALEDDGALQYSLKPYWKRRAGFKKELTSAIAQAMSEIAKKAEEEWRRQT